MTIQTLDTIYYCGNAYLLAEGPLTQHPQLPDFIAISTANHRGYTAVWAVVGDYLYIVSLSGSVGGATRNGLDLVFPSAQAPVLADWYSGDLTLLGGRCITRTEVDLEFEHETILCVGQGRINSARSVTREYSPRRSIDPILLQLVETLDEVGARVAVELKAENISRIGDLLPFSEAALMKATTLDVDTVIELSTALAARGLVLGSRVQGWPPEGGRVSDGLTPSLNW